MSIHTDSAYRIGQVVAAKVDKVFHFGVFVCLPNGTQAYVRRRELTQAGNLNPHKLSRKDKKSNRCR